MLFIFGFVMMSAFIYGYMEEENKKIMFDKNI